MKLKKYILPVFYFVILTSCDYSFPEEKEYTEQDLGVLNTENFVAFGDDFFAGVMDGALYSAGQENSIPAIIATQMSEINEITFNQPLINSENGFNLFKNSGNDIYGKWIYKYLNNTEDYPTLMLTAGENVTDFTGDKSMLNNLAVPQLPVTRFYTPDFDANPYLTRIFSETKSLTEQIVQKSPTLIVGWFGMYDYLNFAMKGAVNPDLLSELDDFENNFLTLVDDIMANTQAKLVLGNLISFEDFPFFYLHQYNFIRLTNQQKGAASARFSAFNQAVSSYNVGKPLNEQRPYISFEDNGATLYPQPVVVIDKSLPDATYPDGSPLEKYRQLHDGEVILFSVTDEMVESGFGWYTPLSDDYYLKTAEIEDIQNHVISFNQVLGEVSEKYPQRILLIDIASQVKRIADTGKFDSWGIPASDETVYEEGVPLEGGINMNGIFSLDAIHFNQRGNAFIANEFIQAINNTFGSNIPKAKINDYIGNLFVF